MHREPADLSDLGGLNMSPRSTETRLAVLPLDSGNFPEESPIHRAIFFGCVSININVSGSHHHVSPNSIPHLRSFSEEFPIRSAITSGCLSGKSFENRSRIVEFGPVRNRQKPAVSESP
jgi:hypothetical protein